MACSAGGLGLGCRRRSHSMCIAGIITLQGLLCLEPLLMGGEVCFCQSLEFRG